MHPMSDGVVLITGGSRGIGRATVELLIGAGRTVAFTFDRDRDAAAEVENAAGGLAHAFQLSLADRGRPASLVAEIEERLGPVDGLVNNAAIERSGLLAMTSDDDWDLMLDTNLGGAFRCCRAVLRAMVPRRRGAIVNVASLSALRGVAGQTAYAASKAGLLAMTRCLAREMGKRRIRVNAVVPGFVATRMTSHLGEDVVARLRDPECLPDATTPGAVAEAVVFLLSDRARAITGQVLTVDSGNSA